MALLAGLIGKGIAGGLGKGLLKGAGEGLLGGAGKGLLGGAGKGLLGGGGKGLLQGLGKGLGKALEAVGGPQGVMDLVKQFTAGGAGAAQGAAEAAPAGGEGAPAPDEKNPLVKLAKALANAKSPADVDKLVNGLLGKLGDKATPELKELLGQVGGAMKAQLGAAAA